MIKKELIHRIWRFAFISLIRDNVEDDKNNIVFFNDNSDTWGANKIVWKFYWCYRSFHF